MLPYTLSRMLEQHQLVLERDAAVPDAFGAEAQPNWQPHGTIKGRYWWWPTKGEGAFDEHADPQRNVNTAGGGALVPRDTDITERDRIARVIFQNGVEAEGPFRITSVREHSDHMELSLERP